MPILYAADRPLKVVSVIIVRVSELDASVKNDLDKQNGFYLREIGRYLLEISAGKRPGKFPKHKNYDKNIEEPENNNLIDVLYKLYQRHSTLWDLEDKRRDKK